MVEFIHLGKHTNTYRRLAIRAIPEMTGYASILKLWDDKRGDRLMPSRSDFGFEDFRNWLGSIAVSVIEGDDLRFTLYGTNYTELLGVDLTGELLCESMDGTLVEETKRYFADLINGPHIGHMSGVAPTKGRDFVSFDVIDLPLSDNGIEVHQFLHALRTNSDPD